jgi:hypothetical protein
MRRELALGICAMQADNSPSGCPAMEVVHHQRSAVQGSISTAQQAADESR